MSLFANEHEDFRRDHMADLMYQEAHEASFSADLDSFDAQFGNMDFEPGDDYEGSDDTSF